MILFKKKVMVIKIAICEDNIYDLTIVTDLLDEYHISHSSISYDTYSNATELLYNLPKHNYQVFLLDILMPGLNGLELASEIRQYNENVKIVFFSSSPEFAVDSYTVNAFYYLLKPLSKNKLYPVLDRLKEFFSKPADMLHIKTNQHIFAIPFSKIEYVEITRKILHFHLIDGTQHMITAPLSDYEPFLLNRNEFLKVHRSYLVNMQNMQALNPGEFITATGKNIPISKRLYTDIRTQYINYIFGAAKEELP